MATIACPVYRRRRSTVLTAAMAFVAMLIPGPAGASQAGVTAQNIIDLLFEAAKQQARKKAYEAWVRKPKEVIGCLSQAYNIDANKLVQQGIGPDDRRVKPYVRNCELALQRAREQAAQAERQRRQAIAEEIARQRAAAEAAALEAKRRAEAEAARIAALRAARIKNLKSRFPDSWVPGILAREVELGWSREAVKEALGPPRQRMRTPDGTEMWSYGSQRVVFTNGEVTYVGD